MNPLNNKLLIVTPTLGRSRYLAETIRSVELYGGDDALHVLVAPLGAIADIKLKFPKAIIATERLNTTSLYDAVNQVTFSGDFLYSGVSYINDDDVLCEGFRRLVSEWRKGDGSGVYYGRAFYLNSAGVSLGYIPVARLHWQILHLISSARMPLAQQGLIIDAELWRRVGGFDLSYKLCADMCFFRDAIAFGARFYYLDADVGGFRLHSAQLSKNSDKMLIESRLIARSIGGFLSKISFIAYGFFIAQNLRVYLSRIGRNGLKRSWEISDNAQ